VSLPVASFVTLSGDAFGSVPSIVVLVSGAENGSKQFAIL